MTIQEGVEEQPERRFACTWEGCGKRFMRRTDVTRHMRIHLNERPYKCEWEGCGKAFMQRSAVKIHYRTHTGEKPNKCPFEGCNKAFNDTSSLARHRRTHQYDRPFPCSKKGCKEHFATRKELIRHEQMHQNESREAVYNNMGQPNYSLPFATPQHAIEGLIQSSFNQRNNNGLMTPCETPNLSPVQNLEHSFHQFHPPGNSILSQTSLPRLNTNFTASYVENGLLSAPYTLGNSHAIANGPFSAPINQPHFFASPQSFTDDFENGFHTFQASRIWERRQSEYFPEKEDYPMTLMRPMYRSGSIGSMSSLNGFEFKQETL